MKVLVVDDSAPALSLIKDILTAKSHDVETAENGETALKKYATFKPDVVTLDLSMPRMDGYQVLKKLRDIDKFANVIMVTASEHSSALHDCLQLGAAGFVSKPFKPRELLETIEKVTAQNGKNKGSGRNAVDVFSHLHKKVEQVLRTTFPNSEISVFLEDVNVVHNGRGSASQKESEKVNSDSVPKDPKKSASQNWDLSFVTMIEGEIIGEIISFVNESDMQILFTNKNVGENQLTKEAIELFNVINSKVLSGLAEVAHLRINGSPAVNLEKPKDKDYLRPSRSNLWNEIVQGTFSIKINGQKMPLRVELWHDGGRSVAR